MVQVFQHSALSYYIPHALGSYNYISISRLSRGIIECVLTVVFSDILQRKRQFRVFMFHDADFAESTLSYNTSEGEVIEAD
jgi:hypothetical protein